MNAALCARAVPDFVYNATDSDIMKCPICEEHVNYEIAIDDDKAFCTCTICDTIIVLPLKKGNIPDYDPPY